MLVDELFENCTTTQALEKALIEMDWAYDVDLNQEDKFNKGHQQLKKIKTLAKSLAANDLATATSLWEEHCPWAAQQPIKHFIA